MEQHIAATEAQAQDVLNLTEKPTEDFNPQPDPPGRHKPIEEFNPQPDPPGRVERIEPFNPQPDPPGRHKQ